METKKRTIPISLFIGFMAGVLVDFAFLDFGAGTRASVLHFLVVGAFTLGGYFWPSLLRAAGLGRRGSS